eukprot:919276_1
MVQQITRQVREKVIMEFDIGITEPQSGIMEHDEDDNDHGQEDKREDRTTTGKVLNVELMMQGSAKVTKREIIIENKKENNDHFKGMAHAIEGNMKLQDQQEGNEEHGNIQQNRVNTQGGMNMVTGDGNNAKEAPTAGCDACDDV